MPTTFWNSRVNGPSSSDLQYIQIIIDELFRNQNGDIAIRFRMPGRRIKVNMPILPILTLKFVAMAKSIVRSEKVRSLIRSYGTKVDQIQI